MAKGKFTRYAETMGADVGLFMNRTIASTLKAGLKAALKHTQQDSGLAAYHWMIVPKGGQFRPGNRRVATFRELYGQAPVGRKGEKRGAGHSTVRDFVLKRENQKVIREALKKKVSVFALYNDTPDIAEDEDAENIANRGYRRNARIDSALAAAHAAMNSKFHKAFAAGNIRQRPIGGAGMADRPFPRI